MPFLFTLLFVQKAMNPSCDTKGGYDDQPPPYSSAVDMHGYANQSAIDSSKNSPTYRQVLHEAFKDNAGIDFRCYLFRVVKVDCLIPC